MSQSVKATPEPEVSDSDVAPGDAGVPAHAQQPESSQSRRRLRRERTFEVASAIALALVAVAIAAPGSRRGDVVEPGTLEEARDASAAASLVSSSLPDSSPFPLAKNGSDQPADSGARNDHKNRELTLPWPGVTIQ